MILSSTIRSITIGSIPGVIRDTVSGLIPTGGDMVFNNTKLAVFLACLLCLGCAANKVPPEIVGKVTYDADFSTLQTNPESFVGRYVILGGEIIGTENLEDHSEILVLQLPLKGNYRPETRNISEGRFIIESQTLLDPEVFRPGESVTVAGEITGSITLPVGSYPYKYPVVAPDRIWTWEPEYDTSPRLHFGFGIGTVF